MLRTLTLLLCTVAAIGVARTVLFGLSLTRDYYACDDCRSLGAGRAIHLFGQRIPLTPVRRTQSMTHAPCDHRWRWYFANSTGILFNSEDWDGPLGDYPWQEWEAAMATHPAPARGKPALPQTP